METVAFAVEHDVIGRKWKDASVGCHAVHSLRDPVAVFAQDEAAPRADRDGVGPIEHTAGGRLEYQLELFVVRIVLPDLAQLLFAAVG